MRVAAAVGVAVSLGAPAPAVADEWVWPVEGRVLTNYANDNARPYAGGMHRGIDIAADVGARVVAARAGTVTHAGVVGSAGLTVAVRTEDQRHVTSYLHLADVAVRRGDSVAPGARVGTVGTTGRRSIAEPHLHFGVRLADREDQYVDPLSLLPSLPGPAVTPAAPLPVPVPLRAEPRPMPVPVPLRAGAPVAPRARPVPRPARVRPSGTVRPGPVVAPRAKPALAAVRRPHSALRPGRVPAGPQQVRSPRRASHPAPAHVPVASPAARSGPGRELLLGGAGLIALVLFGGMVWRGLAHANAGVNRGAAAGARAVCDRARIPSALRRLLSP